MARYFTAEDIGKRVTTAEGDVVGTVERVFGSSVAVKLDPSLSAGTRDRLGIEDRVWPPFEIQRSDVDRVTEEELQLCVGR